MSSANDLVVIAKSWLQREEQFPIDFDEIWERAGYTLRINALRAFHSCVANFEMVEGCEYKSLKINIPNKVGKPGLTFKMTIGAAKRFLASAQTKEGFAIIDALVRAEEELQAIKTDTHAFVASIVDQRMNDMIPMMIEKVTAGVISAITPMLTNAQSNGRPQTKSEPIPLAAAMNETMALFTIRSNYEKAFGGQRNQRFNAVFANACRQFGYSVVHRGGVLFVTPESVRDERVISYVMNAQGQAFARREKIEPGFAKRMRNKIRPAAGQLDFMWNSRN